MISIPVPITIWEQAGIVVLFCFLILAVLSGLYLFIRSMLKQFQDFITARDEQWQKFFEERENSFKERNEEVVNVLRSLVVKIDEHSAETTRAIAIMGERTARKTQLRKAKGEQ
jgi:predicted PurR-regulated permease PerM